MSWKVYDESIDLIERRFHYLPQAFRWHGRRYDVDSVEREWVPRRSPARRHFQLVCAAGRVEIYHDLVANTWHLHRAQWLAEGSRPIRVSRPVRIPRPARVPHPTRATGPATVGLRQMAFQEETV